MSELHQQLLGLVRTRKSGGLPFGQGFVTADRFASNVIDCVGSAVCKRYAPEGQSTALAIKEAAGKLAYTGSQLTVEKLATSENDIRKELKGVDLPPHSMMFIKHVLTTPREDRDTDVLETSGANVDAKMPLLWQHIHTLPIGKLVVILEHTAQVLRMGTVLLDINELTSDAAKLVEAEALRFSHGFRALKFTEMTKGFRVIEFEIMEESLVSVPSNIDAEIELFSRGKLKSDLCKMHAKALWATVPKKFAGIGKSFSELKTAVDAGALSVESATEMSKAMLAAPVEAKHDCGCQDKNACQCDQKTPDVNVSTGGDVFATELDAEMRGSTLGCLGAHQLADGTWMPCANPQVYQEYAGAVASLPAPQAPRLTVSADPTVKSYEYGATVKLADGSQGVISLIQPGPVYGVTVDGTQRKWLLQSELTIVQGADNGGYGEQNTASAKPAPKAADTEVLSAAEISAIVDGKPRQKAGKVLSQRNQARLQDCHDTLEEMEGMDGLPRAAKSMCKDCRGTIKAVMDEATTPEKPETDKPEETSTDHAIKQILGCGDAETLTRVRNACDAILAVQKSDKRVEQYRKHVKRTPAPLNGSAGK